MTKPGPIDQSGQKNDPYVCASCGNCTLVCPVFRQMRWEPYGPRGKLSITKSIYQGESEFNRDFTRKLYLCTLCEHCTSVCTTSIRLDRFWELMREEAMVRNLTPAPVEFASESVKKMGDPFSIGRSSRLLWTEGMEDIIRPRIKANAETAFFLGCNVSLKHQLHGVARSMIRIMEHASVNYTLLGNDEACCGAPLLWAGEPEGTPTMVEMNAQALADLGVRKVVFSCPSCASTWISSMHKSAGTSAARKMELLTASQFINQLIQKGRLTFEEQPMITATYHDPCISARVLGVAKEPRNVIERIPGVYRVEMVSSEEDTRCCGSHALLNMIDPHLSAQIAEMRLRDASVTPASLLVTECPRCEMAFDLATITLGYSIEILDIAQLVANSLSSKSEGGEKID
ncbi:MAG: (Fe-S)-binding protein [Candidatus Thorarchaeota archaeon]